MEDSIGFEAAVHGIVKFELLAEMFVGEKEGFYDGEGVEGLGDIKGVLLIGVVAVEDGNIKNLILKLFSKGYFDATYFCPEEVDVGDTQFCFFVFEFFEYFLDCGLEIDVLVGSGDQADVDVRLGGP